MLNVRDKVNVHISTWGKYIIVHPHLRMLYNFLKKNKKAPSLLMWNDPQDILLIATINIDASQYVFYESKKEYAYAYMYIHKLCLKGCSR